MNTSISASDTPSDFLEQRAAQQRRKLQESVSELRDRVKDQLDVASQARHHVWSAAAAAALLSVLVGYGVASFIKGPGSRR